MDWIDEIGSAVQSSTVTWRLSAPVCWE